VCLHHQQLALASGGRLGAVCLAPGRQVAVIRGQVRADTRILYATTAGKILHLNRSNTLEAYRFVVFLYRLHQ
jgi:hypothetical protein